MKKIILSMFVAASVSVSAAESLTKQLPTAVHGRVVETQQENGDKAWQYSWPSIYFEAAFKGESAVLKFDDDQNYFRLIVDNGEPILINKPGKVDYPVKNLKKGSHQLRLEKLTETQFSTGRFNGFYTAANAQAESVPTRTKKIEFIGDSYTVGYGNISKTRDCTTDDVFAATQSQLAFGPLTAKALNADYQINASSGFGIVRNYNGIRPENSLIKLYNYTLNDTSVEYKGDWDPQVIVIGLGTNDFSTPLNAGERWKTRADLQADYVANYVAFVQKLAGQHQGAQFILMASDQLNGEIAQQVEKVASQVKASNVKVDTIIFKGLDYAGCHWHPSTADDKLISDLLLNYFKAHPGVI